MDQVLPDVLELLDDEEQQVRYAVMITIIDMISVLPKDFFTRKILPKLLDMTKESINYEGESFPTFSQDLPRKFGLMFHSVFSEESFFEDEASCKLIWTVLLHVTKKLASNANVDT